MSLPTRDLYGNVNVGFTSSPPNTPSAFEEKPAKVFVIPFEEKALKEAARDRPLFCKSTSHDAKRVSLHCQLQVIQEVNEEEILDEEEGPGRTGPDQDDPEKGGMGHKCPRRATQSGGKNGTWTPGSGRAGPGDGDETRRPNTQQKKEEPRPTGQPGQPGS
ncbi:hypothetical protein ACROYT_G007607 [Oculina patagonica]